MNTFFKARPDAAVGAGKRKQKAAPIVTAKGKALLLHTLTSNGIIITLLFFLLLFFSLDHHVEMSSRKFVSGVGVLAPGYDGNMAGIP